MKGHKILLNKVLFLQTTILVNVYIGNELNYLFLCEESQLPKTRYFKNAKLQFCLTLTEPVYNYNWNSYLFPIKRFLQSQY